MLIGRVLYVTDRIVDKCIFVIFADDAVNAAGIKANVGFPGEEIRDPVRFDVSKSKRVLGIEYRDIKQAWVETTQNLLDRFGPVVA